MSYIYIYICIFIYALKTSFIAICHWVHKTGIQFKQVLITHVNTEEQVFQNDTLCWKNRSIFFQDVGPVLKVGVHLDPYKTFAQISM